MAEFEVYVEEEYEDDVYIEFSNLDREQKAKLIDAIIHDKSYTFEDIPLVFAGDVTVDIEPRDYY